MALRYNKLGSLLASGSKDNDVILWDVVGETGLFRLRGHRDQVLTSHNFLISSCITCEFLILVPLPSVLQVTDLVFLDSGNKLVTASKVFEGMGS